MGRYYQQLNAVDRGVIVVIKIKKTRMVHYILIYFLIITNQSCLYEYFLKSDNIRIGILMLIGVAIFIHYKSLYTKYLLMIGVLLFTTAITRFLVGGIGLMAWIWWVIPILLSVYVIEYDRENFLELFVKVAVFLAFVGIIYFVIQITLPQLIKKILITEYNTAFSSRTWSDYYNYQEYFHKGYGLFTYSYKSFGDSLFRNKGIFTEPAICQMLYNSAIFILLFFSDKIKTVPRKTKRYLLILIIAQISVQSTTGYITLGVILFSYLLIKQKGKKSFKNYIFIAVSLALLGLFIDFALRGTDSFLNITVIQKLFGEDNNFEIQTSGQYRIGAFLVSIQTMLTNPLGAGADKFSIAMQLGEMAGGGAGIFKFGAMTGIIPFIIAVLFYTKPIIQSEEKISVRLLLLFMIFNTLFAQSTPFYPLLMIFPIYFMEDKNHKNLLMSGD